MPKTRQQKEGIVSELKDKLVKAKSVILADYKGLNMKQLSELRDKLRDQEAEFTITKNTLLKLALPTSDFRLPTSELEGPTAILFSYDDETSPLKILAKTLQDSGIGKIRFGYLGAEFMDEAKLTELSTLPTKDELRGKTVGILVAPLQGMVSVLQGNLRNLVYELDQIRLQKGGV